MPVWAQVITPVLAVLLGIVLAEVLNSRREKRQEQHERVTAAHTLLAEVDMIGERLLKVVLSNGPEYPKRDYSKALYHSLQPKLGLFRPDTVKALVKFYQNIELIEAEAYVYNEGSLQKTDRDKHLLAWKKAVGTAQKNLLSEVESTLKIEKDRRGIYPLLERLFRRWLW